MRFRIGCRLAYQTESAVPFVFNIEAQAFPGQAVEHERLVLSPDIPIDRWTRDDVGNRYFRITPPAGLVTLDYSAVMDITPSLGDAAEVREIPPGALPLAVLPDLFPSRYCQSDRLQRFAVGTFGDLPPGYARVNAICNWIHDYVTYEGGVSDG